ncbi:uncharacterized protein [Macrobrachium rosenbergii]|uniref:uncharacterized protein n=1 Tax=Macrobrachium rosenbergii TaxID=79674 RepID=UPI0034D7706C
MVDCSARWPEAAHITKASEAACPSAFHSSWVSRFVPNHITSYRGTTFTSQLRRSLNRLLGTQLRHATAYHPESNGMVERFHCTLKSALMSCCNSSTWYLQLPRVLLGLWTTPKEGLDLSAAKMVCGDPLEIPGKFFSDNNPSPDIIRLRTIVGKFAPDRPSYKPTNKTFIPKDLHTATHVVHQN